jgi:lipopolysaccharide export system permease protein
MIFFELFRVFLLCWLGLTGMILLGGVIAEATQQGLGPMQILEIIPLLIPNTMPYTLPTTTLFATCVVYGRLSHDNEILAVKAAGINLFHLTLPAIFLGMMMSGFTLYLYLGLIPESQWEIKTHFVRNVEEFLYGMLRKDGRIATPQIPYIIQVERVEGRSLINAYFMHLEAKTRQFDFIAQGKKAELTVDAEHQELNVRMWNGVIRKDNGDSANFDVQDFPVEMPKDFFEPKKMRPSHMSWPELATCKEQNEVDLATTLAKIAIYQPSVEGGLDPDHAQHIAHLMNYARLYENNILNVHVEYQLRPALSLGCLCFVLVGCPVGIWFSRSDYLSSFITCFLPIIIVYYPLMLCGINMARSGKAWPAAVWPANAVMAIAALVLFRRLLRN